MTTLQKEYIRQKRNKGESYSIISSALGISENTVKSYCRRNNLGTKFIAEQSAVLEDLCDNCGKPLEHRQGSKRKRFCSNVCRLSWWKAHPELLGKKAVYSFVCPHCGAGFTAYGNKERKYCSHACYVADRFGKSVAT